MKKLFKFTLVIIALLLIKPVMAQNFKGAEATKAHYKAIYYLNSNDPAKIKATLRNMDNAMDDARLKGKIELELVVFGDGTATFMKENPYEETLLALQKKGVILSQCNNTIRERQIDTATLFPFINYVPSGNGEIIIRQQEGWAAVHP
ncbi:DsrE family protein [Mucilaginibacter glaciei]|uniref:DsrE family protein n=1 Tax=Mucilaginibacter glaciei TaxID=2772109 RepID=A0A926S0N7_9SPHI|nr:DsrE family protein [Mucilaginibacter glaciei]MBD1391932.1 DsrE family protein [Mucilaginibacter glaciei]